MKPLECLVFVSLGAVWGSAFLFIKYAAEAFPPFTLVAMRLLLGSVFMGGYILIRSLMFKGYREITKEHLIVDKSFYWKITIMGALNNAIPFVLVAWAESKPAVNVGIASVLDSTIPLFGQLFGHFLLKGEQLTKWRVAGLIVGFLGVLVVCSEKIFNAADDAAGSCVACDIGYYMMIIVASASYGIASVWGKRALHKYEAVMCSAGQIISGCLITVVFALVWEFNWPPDEFVGKTRFSFMADADYMAWISIVYLGLISTCLAYVFYFYLLRTIGCVKQTMVGFLLPVFGIIEGVIVYHDWDGVNWIFKVAEVIGGVLVVAGIAFVNFIAPRTECGASVVDTEKEPLLKEKQQSHVAYHKIAGDQGDYLPCGYGGVPQSDEIVPVNADVECTAVVR
eukprot:Colp12_sorted_trinity150504_noHs@22486